VTVAVDNKTEKDLESLYDLHHPDVPEDGPYQLMAMGVENGSGMLSCRVNGEHIQVRS